MISSSSGGGYEAAKLWLVRTGRERPGATDLLAAARPHSETSGVTETVMTITVSAKALALWFAIVVIAIVNGALREKALILIMGSFAGLIASGIILSGCIFAIAFFAARWYGPLGSSQYWAIGLFWFLFTLLFEFGFGRFVQHKDWSNLIQAYTFEGGNIWPIVLVVTLVSPWVAARLRGLV